MRVLQLHTNYRHEGGEDQVVRAEGELLRSAGHEVRLVAARNATGPRAGIQLAASLWNPRAAQRVRLAAAEFEPEVIHVHNTWFALSPAAVASARAYASRVVMTLHNFRLTCSNGLLYRDGRPCEDCIDSHPWHGLRHRCYRGSYVASAPAAAGIAMHRWRGTWARHVDHFLVLTDFARSRLVAGGLPSNKIRVKPNFVREGPARRESPSESNRVLYVGRLSQEKGIELLIDVWEAAGLHDLELVVLGTGPLGKGLEQRASGRIRFVGGVNNLRVREEMAAARALVIPSVCYEGQPIALLEALNAGLPIIASDAGPLVETLAPLGSDLLLQLGNRVAWRDGLRVLMDDHRLNEAGAAARRLYEARFTPERACDMLEEVYRS